jgi:simple sugar transport system substrate-binding protein
VKFIYITPFVGEEFFVPVKQGMKDAADLLKVQCEFTGIDGAEFAAFGELVEKAIADKYDGIALSFAHGEQLTPLVKKALAAKIPVIAFNMDCPATGRLAGVSQNFYNAGLVLGKRAAEKIKKNITVLGVMHDPGVNALDERLRGICDGLKSLNVTVKTLISGNDPELAKEAVLKALEPEIGAVLCTGQPDLQGSAMAISALPASSRPYLSGFDVSDEIKGFIKEGIIDCTIDQQPYVQGYYPLLMLYQILRSGVTPFDIDCGSAVVDKSVL